jgi:hypothetical protein
MRWHQIAKAARRALADLVMGGRGRLARSSDAGVYSGWIGPDGRIEAAPGTAIHVTLLARFGEVTKEAFFAKGAVRYVDATDHVSLELMSQHPVALGNAIEALTRRWAHMADVDVEFRAPPEVLRASSAEVRQVLGRRLRAIEASDGPTRPMNSAGTIRTFQQAIVALAQSKLGRPLTAKEHTFITARGGFVALEAISDTVTAATPTELEEYLNTE